MSPEEISRTIEFILQSQANAANRMEDDEKRLRELAESTSRQIREMSDSTSRQIRELSDSTCRQIRELTASTSRFQEDVKGFIQVLVPILEIQSKRLDLLEGLR